MWNWNYRLARAYTHMLNASRRRRRRFSHAAAATTTNTVAAGSPLFPIATSLQHSYTTRNIESLGYTSHGSAVSTTVDTITFIADKPMTVRAGALSSHPSESERRIRTHATLGICWRGPLA